MTLALDDHVITPVENSVSGGLPAPAFFQSTTVIGSAAAGQETANIIEARRAVRIDAGQLEGVLDALMMFMVVCPVLQLLFG